MERSGAGPLLQQSVQRGHGNRATLEVARKLVAYLLAVDKSGKPFQIRITPATVEQEVQEVATYPRQCAPQPGVKAGARACR